MSFVTDTKAALAASNAKRKSQAAARGSKFYAHEGYFGGWYVTRIEDLSPLLPSHHSLEEAEVEITRLNKQWEEANREHQRREQRRAR